MGDKELGDEIKKLNDLGNMILHSEAANPKDKNSKYYAESIKAVGEEIIAAKNEQQRRTQNKGS